MPSFGTTMLWNASISPHGRIERERERGRRHAEGHSRGGNTPQIGRSAATHSWHTIGERLKTLEKTTKKPAPYGRLETEREREKKERASFYSNVLAFKVCFGCIGIIWTECSSLDGLARCINSGEKKGKSHLSLFSQRTKDFSIVSISIHRQGRANNRVRRGARFYLPESVFYDNDSDCSVFPHF